LNPTTQFTAPSVTLRNLMLAVCETQTHNSQLTWSDSWKPKLANSLGSPIGAGQVIVAPVWPAVRTFEGMPFSTPFRMIMFQKSTGPTFSLSTRSDSTHPTLQCQWRSRIGDTRTDPGETSFKRTCQTSRMCQDTHLNTMAVVSKVGNRSTVAHFHQMMQGYGNRFLMNSDYRTARARFVGIAQRILSAGERHWVNNVLTRYHSAAFMTAAVDPCGIGARLEA